MTLLTTAARAVDTALDRTIAPGYTRIGYHVRRHLPSWPADPRPSALAGREVAVSGATSGLGKACARQLLGLGAHVHLIVRDEAKGDDVAAEIDPSGSSTTVWRCDVGDLDSVADFAGRFVASGARLRGLVHNAGVMPPERTESDQGHELSMSVHLLGPLAMTDALLPAMQGEQTRVVFVTSGGMYTQELPLDDPEYRLGEYSGTTAYARSKRAQVELMHPMQRRWAGHDVRVCSMHPGWAGTPGVAESLPLFDTITGPVLRTAEEGADTTTWLIARDERPQASTLWHDRRPRPTSYLSRTMPTPTERERFWEWATGAARLT